MALHQRRPLDTWLVPVRIWSTDWYSNSTHETEKLVNWLNNIISNYSEKEPKKISKVVYWTKGQSVCNRSVVSLNLSR